MTIHHDDILKFDMSNVFPEEAAMPWDGPTPHIYLIGNLPFSVSTPLIIKVSKHVAFPLLAGFLQFCFCVGEMVQNSRKVKIWFGFYLTFLKLYVSDDWIFSY